MGEPEIGCISKIFWAWGASACIYTTGVIV